MHARMHACRGVAVHVHMCLLLRVCSPSLHRHLVSIHLPTYLSTDRSLCRSIYLPIYLYISIHIYIHTHNDVYLFASVYLHLSADLSINASVYIGIYLFTRDCLSTYIQYPSSYQYLSVFLSI